MSEQMCVSCGRPKSQPVGSERERIVAWLRSAEGHSAARGVGQSPHPYDVADALARALEMNADSPAARKNSG